MDDFWDDPAYYESIGYDPTTYVPSNYDYVDTSFTNPDYSWADVDYGNFWDSSAADLASIGTSDLGTGIRYEPQVFGDAGLGSGISPTPVWNRDYSDVSYPDIVKYSVPTTNWGASLNEHVIVPGEYKEQEYVLNDAGQVVGYVDENNRYHPMSESTSLEKAARIAAQAAAPRTAQERIMDALAKNYEQQVAAKEAYNKSGIGQGLTASAAGLAALQAMFGKNKGATTTSRASQGQAFSQPYQGGANLATKYAEGGSVGYAKGGLLKITERLAEEMMKEKGLIGGEAGGQDDVVDIKAAPGEYIMDAEVVSALGDGNNQEGARKLDEMRINVRKHKRQGGLASIPPKAKKPEQYMKKGK